MGSDSRNIVYCSLHCNRVCKSPFFEAGAEDFSMIWQPYMYFLVVRNERWTGIFWLLTAAIASSRREGLISSSYAVYRKNNQPMWDVCKKRQNKITERVIITLIDYFCEVGLYVVLAYTTLWSWLIYCCRWLVVTVLTVVWMKITVTVEAGVLRFDNSRCYWCVLSTLHPMLTWFGARMSDMYTKCLELRNETGRPRCTLVCNLKIDNKKILDSFGSVEGPVEGFINVEEGCSD
jgi:hypothetical protein